MTAIHKLGPNKAFLPYGRQTLDQEDLDAVVAVLQSDYLTTGPVCDLFEQALASEVNARHAVVVSSGTAALHLAALALGLGPEDSVIVPTMTFVATANAARFVGAEVVFADVDPNTGLMTPETFLGAIERCSGRPRAVFPVHINGQSVELEELYQLAKKHDMAIVEDACHALGTTHLSKDSTESRVGASRYSDLTVFSFHPVKTIAMGEGGALTTNDGDLADRLRQLRNHGLTRNPAQFTNPELALSPEGTPNPWYYEMRELAFNYRASDIHCALGLSQLKKLSTFVETRRTLVEHYCRRLEDLGEMVVPVETAPWNDPAWHLFVAHIDFESAGISRASLMNALKENGIGSQVHYLPVHLQPYYSRRYGPLELAGAESYYERCLSLPLHGGMTANYVDRVIDTLRQILQIKI